MIELAKKFVALTREKRERNAELRQIEETLGELEEELVTIMTNESVGKFSVDGMTVFPQKHVYVKAKGGDQQAAVEALYKYGVRTGLMLSTMRLRAMVKEDPEGLPPEVMEHLEVTERYKLGARSQ